MQQNKKRLPLWLFLLLQLALAGLVLSVFALFHHVIPFYNMRHEGVPVPIAEVERTETPAPAEETTEALPAESAAPETAEEPHSMSWAERFAGQFSEETVWEDMHYSSPTMAVTVTKYAYTELLPRSVCYVADIYLSDLEQLKTAFPQDGSTFAPPEAIAAAADAVIAVNGDCFANQRGSFLVRNGQLYDENHSTADICVLYCDGRMETYSPADYTTEDVIDGEPWQVWHFGPALLNLNGRPMEYFNISDALLANHPRTAIGYFEPGHYCFVVVDGRRSNYSVGADMKSLSAFMSELGCKAAYNLDGGASSVMIFNGEIVNRPNGERRLNDLVIAAEIREEEQ